MRTNEVNEQKPDDHVFRNRNENKCINEYGMALKEIRVEENWETN